MIACPPGWSLQVESSRCILTPPEGAGVGVVTYTSLVRPVVRFAQTVQALLASDARFSSAATRLEQSPIEPLITAEGEYAALTTVRATLRQQTLHRYIGAVYGDDCLSVLDVVAVSEQHADWLGQLARHFLYHAQLGLGVRPRRYYHKPPAGWMPLASGLVCTYYPPDFPKNAVALIAQPATPLEGSIDDVWASLLLGSQRLNFLIEDTHGPEPITSESGLHGKTYCLVGRMPGNPQSFRDLVVLADARYQYALMLESGDARAREQCRALLPQVARSIRPIPSPLHENGKERPTSFAYLTK
ncbi:MAG: hypothetical protein KA244_00795 [Deltaproteobacteria bacterium]|nr:hypothetical protein [Deltaproteobacteria bacterium]